MKNLLSPSTKTIIKTGVGAFLFAIATTFGMNSCDTSTSPTTTPEVSPHPDKIGMIGDVEIRASFAITPEQEADLLYRLGEAFINPFVAEHDNFHLLRIINITGFGSTDRNILPGGIMEGIAPIEDSLVPWVFNGLEDSGWTTAHNMTEEEMLLANFGERKADTNLRIASRSREGIVL